MAPKISVASKPARTKTPPPPRVKHHPAYIGLAQIATTTTCAHLTTTPDDEHD